MIGQSHGVLVPRDVHLRRHPSAIADENDLLLEIDILNEREIRGDHRYTSDDQLSTGIDEGIGVSHANVARIGSLIVCSDASNFERSIVRPDVKASVGLIDHHRVLLPDDLEGAARTGIAQAFERLDGVADGRQLIDRFNDQFGNVHERRALPSIDLQAIVGRLFRAADEDVLDHGEVDSLVLILAVQNDEIVRRRDEVLVVDDDARLISR